MLGRPWPPVTFTITWFLTQRVGPASICCSPMTNKRRLRAAWALPKASEGTSLGPKLSGSARVWIMIGLGCDVPQISANTASYDEFTVTLTGTLNASWYWPFVLHSVPATSRHLPALALASSSTAAPCLYRILRQTSLLALPWSVRQARCRRRTLVKRYHWRLPQAPALLAWAKRYPNNSLKRQQREQ